MPYFAQKNYDVQLGHGPLTILMAGCLLTSFCNAEVKKGRPIAPDKLNEYFKQHGMFILPDNLSWHTLNQYDNGIKFVNASEGHSPPEADVIIVKFTYQSILEPFTIDAHGKKVANFIDHYCLVDRIENGQIIIADSWDGLIKPPDKYEGVYHKPVSWAIYSFQHAPAAAVKPAPKPPAGAFATPPKETYKVIVKMAGYLTAQQASDRHGSNSTVQSGTYYVYNRNKGMLNISIIYGRPGWWINTEDNHYHLPPRPVKKPQVLKENVQARAVTFMTSYKPFPKQPANYYALDDIIVHDIDKRRPDLMLHKYDLVPLAGTFVADNGILEGRTMTSVKNGWWYGIPMSNLISENELYSIETDIMTRQYAGTPTVHDRFSIVLGKVQNVLEHFAPNKFVKK